MRRMANDGGSQKNPSLMSRASRNLLAGLASVALLFLLPSKAWAPQYTGGPSVRVTPNVSVEFKRTFRGWAWSGYSTIPTASAPHW
jgi:hypothetical protein